MIFKYILYVYTWVTKYSYAQFVQETNEREVWIKAAKDLKREYRNSDHWGKNRIMQRAINVLDNSLNKGQVQ